MIEKTKFNFQKHKTESAFLNLENLYICLRLLDESYEQFKFVNLKF